MKQKKSGLTIIELLTVIAVIAILMGMLIPTVSMVRRNAKEAKQKAQLTAVELAIVAFKNDYGDYPPSTPTLTDRVPYYYPGAQKLTEALLGWDLLGFHPNSVFRSDGEDGSGTEIYPTPLNPNNPVHIQNLQARKGPYLDRGTSNVFKLNQLFNNLSPSFDAETFVLCDIFGVRRISGTKVKAGTPILYYKANTSSKIHNVPPATLVEKRIYNVWDNRRLVDLKTLTPDGSAGDDHPIANSSGDYQVFYDFIKDPKAPIPWPHRPDSYILISAGADGEYGTSDDITNF